MFNRDVVERLDEIKSLIKCPRGLAGTMDSLAEAEEKLGIESLMDFYRADVATFAIPERKGEGPTYTTEEWVKRSTNIPALAKSIRTFLTSASSEFSYAAMPLVWIPKDYKNKGYAEFTTWGPCILVSAFVDPRFAYHTPERFTADLITTIRGSHDYGRQSIAVLAFSRLELEKYFVGGTFPRLKENVQVPIQNILGTLGGPTDEERELLDGAVRGYWDRLRKLGYFATERKDLKYGDNPDKDPLPAILANDNPNLPAKIGLGGEWGAQGTLEGWHRLAKINKLISEHKANALASTAGGRL